MILQGNLNTAGESANWSNHFGNPAEMSTKAEHLRVYSTEMHMNLYQKTYTRVFSTAQFIEPQLKTPYKSINNFMSQ